MNKLPLYLRLKRESHKRIAEAQDIIIEEVYKQFNNAVLHGGTGIWRCYSGKRFSEDLDFYLPNDKNKLEELFLELGKRGFNIIKKKISESSVYSELEFNRVSVRLEATFQKVDGVLADYETADGNIISIFSLTPKDFIFEKVNTYLKRFKVRDLWDIFFLSRGIDYKNDLAGKILELIKGYKPPVDKENIYSIILEGVIPSADDMISYIKRKWEKENT